MAIRQQARDERSELLGRLHRRYSYGVGLAPLRLRLQRLGWRLRVGPGKEANSTVGARKHCKSFDDGMESLDLGRRFITSLL